MALTTTEEAQVRQLIDQNAALLSLASNEPTIISKLAAAKISLADLTAASALNDADLFLLRQGTQEKSLTGTLLKSYAATVVPNATETVKGIVELATVAEVQTGTDTTRAVTPAGLVSMTATETRRGLVELATSAEAQAFTENKFIDGAKLADAFNGSNSSLSASGYQKLPSGLIIQWGFRAAASGNVWVTFPLAFPTACASVNATRSTGGSDLWPPEIQSVINTGFTYLQSGNSGASMPVYWIAIGY